MTLQESHDKMVEQLATLLSQMIYGHHSPTRMQVLTALSVLREAIPLAATPPAQGIVRPTVEYIDTLTKEVMPPARAESLSPIVDAIRGGNDDSK